jgi:transposase, IS6 family
VPDAAIAGVALTGAEAVGNAVAAAIAAHSTAVQDASTALKTIIANAPMLSSRRTAKAAARFLGKALKNRADFPPETINTDQNEDYGTAIRRLKREGKIEAELQHRQVKYLNNRLEGDHGALKRVIRPMRGFKSMPTAYAAIKGIEVMRMIRKGNCVTLDPGVAGEVRFVNRLFYLPT